MQNIIFCVHFRFRELLDREHGATAVEYGLMVGLIAVVIIATVALLGGQLNLLFERVTSELSKVAPGGTN